MSLASSSSPPEALTRADVPRVVVDVDGAVLNDPKDGVSLLRVDVRHELGRPSSVVIETADLDAESLDWIDGDLVQEGRPLTIEMGLGETTGRVFLGEITGLDLEIDPDDAPRVSIRGYDRLHRLARARKTRAFVGQRDSQIAEAVCGDHGLRLAGPDSKLVHDYVMQREQTDLAFLLARARGLGFVVRVEDKELYFGPRDLAGSPAGAAKLGVNLLSLSASTSVLGQVGTVTARVWDPAEQRAVLVEAAESALASKMGGKTSGPALADRGFSAEKTAVVDLPLLTEDAAKLAAAAELEAIALGHVVCRGRMLGAPLLRPGKLLTIGGFTGRFAGDYFLTHVTHTFSRDGFVTEFEGRRTAT